MQIEVVLWSILGLTAVAPPAGHDRAALALALLQAL